MNREREGLLLCLLSAAGFAAMPIFARQAYATGIELTPLLALRFVIAAAMLWALVLLRRRPLGSPRGLALGAALGTGSIDPLGAAMALACAGFYTVFILGSERASAKVAAVPFAASVATGAAVTFAIAALFTGGVHASGEGVFWAAVIALVSTVIPIVLFTAGLARVGASTTAIASTVEPALTVALAWLVLGETLGPLQLAGGALVLSAVVLLQLRAVAPRRLRLRLQPQAS